VTGKENIIHYPCNGVSNTDVEILKKINTILIIALCLSFLVLPVIAAKEGQGIHAGITVGAAENNGQYQGDKSGVSGAAENHTSSAPTQNVIRGNQQDARGGNRNISADTSRAVSPIPGLKNQSGEDHGASLRNVSPVPSGWVRNPNEVRDAVHSLLAMENRTGGIGPQVSAIARKFNNSANVSQQYENRITNRDVFSRFFFGGDRQAATELANLTAQNQARIAEIENLMNSTTLDADTRSMMDEQLQLLQQNVVFDQQLAAQAQKDRGIFGWFG
jgi:hypothetical protein